MTQTRKSATGDKPWPREPDQQSTAKASHGDKLEQAVHSKTATERGLPQQPADDDNLGT